MEASDTPRRLEPRARREQILRAARTCLADGGTTAFTVEEVARRASVTGSLLRHYFGSREGLLVAVCHEVLDEVMGSFLAGPQAGGLQPRLAAYIDFAAENSWCHGVWMHVSEVHPDLEETVSAARDGLAAFSFDLDWERTPLEVRLRALGWVGAVEAVIAAWIDDGAEDPAVPLAVLLDAARRLGVRER